MFWGIAVVHVLITVAQQNKSGLHVHVMPDPAGYSLLCGALANPRYGII